MKLHPDEPRGPVTEPFLVVCEGLGDAEFLKELGANRRITGLQYEHLTSHERDAPSGSGGFKRYLQGLSVRQGFPGLKAVLIVADNDDEPKKSFQRVARQVKDAGLTASNEPGKIGYRRGVIPTCVLMLPVGRSSQQGCLETQLLDAARDRHPKISRCVEDYVKCVEAEGLPTTWSSKLRLRCIIAVAFPEDPNISLAWAVHPSKNLIPLDHPCFDPIAEFLTGFPSAAKAAARR